MALHCSFALTRPNKTKYWVLQDQAGKTNGNRIELSPPFQVLTPHQLENGYFVRMPELAPVPAILEIISSNQHLINIHRWPQNLENIEVSTSFQTTSDKVKIKKIFRINTLAYDGIAVILRTNDQTSVFQIYDRVWKLRCEIIIFKQHIEHLLWDDYYLYLAGPLINQGGETHSIVTQIDLWALLLAKQATLNPDSKKHTFLKNSRIYESDEPFTQLNWDNERRKILITSKKSIITIPIPQHF